GAAQLCPGGQLAHRYDHRLECAAIRMGGGEVELVGARLQLAQGEAAAACARGGEGGGAELCVIAPLVSDCGRLTLPPPTRAGVRKAGPTACMRFSIATTRAASLANFGWRCLRRGIRVEPFWLLRSISAAPSRPPSPSTSTT